MHWRFTKVSAEIIPYSEDCVNDQIKEHDGNKRKVKSVKAMMEGTCEAMKRVGGRKQRKEQVEAQGRKRRANKIPSPRMETE